MSDPCQLPRRPRARAKRERPASSLPLTLVQGLLPVRRKITEQGGVVSPVERLDQRFEGGGSGWFVVFNILVEHGEKFVSLEIPCGESVEKGNESAEFRDIPVLG